MSPLCPACQRPLAREQSQPRPIGGVRKGPPLQIFVCRDTQCREVYPGDYFLSATPG